MPTKTADAPTKGRLREYTTGQAAPVRVDAEKGILYDVLFLGHSSRNRADYSQAVMQEALSQYEGALSYSGHTKDGTNPDPDKAFGVPRNCHVAADGIRGDYHFPPKHRLAEDLVWRAQQSPRSVGFSHDAECTFTMDKGRKRVQKIDTVFSVDYVTRPATTRGLFEDEGDDTQRMLESDPVLKTMAEHGFAAMDTARSIILAPDVPVAEKRERLVETATEWLAELQEQITPKETGMGVEYKDMTVESIVKERPDLAELLRGTDERSRMVEEAAAIKKSLADKDAELAVFKADKAAHLKEEEIAAELKAANFPVADEKVYTAVFKESLVAAPDKAKRAALIADRMELVKDRMQEETFTAPPLGEMRPVTEKAASKEDTTRFFGS
jgi:hypothetical protein